MFSNLVGFSFAEEEKKTIYSRNVGEFYSHIAPILCVPVYNTDFEKILFDVFVSLAKTRMEKKIIERSGTFWD